MNKMSIFKILRFVPDKLYLKMMYYKHLRKRLSLKEPKTLNEKLQWLKLYNRNPEYTVMVDKINAKEYVAGIVGKKHIIPTIQIFDSVDEINVDELPDKFVLKCNHDSKSVCICNDKKFFNIEEAKKMLNSGLHENGYWYGREWPYKNVKPRILAEKYMTDNEYSDEFTDYKFFCFNGYVDCVMVCLGRGTGDTKFYFFDRNWELKRLNKGGQAAPKDFTLPKPKCIDEMFDIAAKLSTGIPFVRVDLYQSNDTVYFGEMTFYPDSGFDKNILPEADIYWGSLIDLPEKRG
jgi:hypothetical protein